MKRFVLPPLMGVALLALAVPVWGDAISEEEQQAQEEKAEEVSATKQLFEQTCSACHGIRQATNQNLNRADWHWVMDDMEDYGMTWLTDEQREDIVDYLVENHGYGD
ncbi:MULTISPECIES: cytochrome c [unclassified Thioalkalivibrio]|uniref:c-type cytochrome n=1 Tax=unclassified Thioalkalivibrio TaxID=2621013 RepID=UPI00037D694B|nr:MULTISPECIES: cytochrome c [unclassified Thioalkalivibrio]